MSTNTPRFKDNMDKLLTVAPDINQVHLVLWGEPPMGAYAAHSRTDGTVVVKQADGSMESEDLSDVKAILIGDLDAIREALR